MHILLMMELGSFTFMTGILCVNINSTKHRNKITHKENTRLNQGSNSEHF